MCSNSNQMLQYLSYMVVVVFDSTNRSILYLVYLVSILHNRGLQVNSNNRKKSLWLSIMIIWTFTFCQSWSQSWHVMCTMLNQSKWPGLRQSRWFDLLLWLIFSLSSNTIWAEYNGHITELTGVPIARCVPQILDSHDWLNMVHNMTRLAQFSQQV